MLARARRPNILDVVFLELIHTGDAFSPPAASDPSLSAISAQGVVLWQRGRQQAQDGAAATEGDVMEGREEAEGRA